MAGLTASVPGIMWLAYRAIVFTQVAARRISNHVRQARNAPCPVDPMLAASCMRLRRNSRWIWQVQSLFMPLGYFSRICSR